MTTRTIPKYFPIMRKEELYARKVLKGSLMRKLAQMQNYLWARQTKIYANHGYEGCGNTLYHTRPAATATGPGGLVVSNLDFELAPDGAGALPVCSFLLPPNWCGGKRISIEGNAVLAAAAATTGDVLIGVYTLDEDFTGVQTSYRATSAGDNYFALELAVPQDKMYQVKVFIRLNDAAVGSENSTADGITLTFVSARYKVANTTELGGDAVITTWKPTDELQADDDDESINAAILQRILQNTMHLYAYRGPEVCQSWLGAPNHNTTTYTEVGRYQVVLPPLITGITGKLVVWCTHGGANNNVRVKANGSVVFTSADLSVGENTVDVTQFTGLSGAVTLTVEARSSAASGEWGTMVNGVSFYETQITQGLGSITLPASYAPLDEDGLNGDDPIAIDDNAAGQITGIAKLIRNDRWLCANRFRHLVGDWRHRVYKRVTLGGYSDHPAFQPIDTPPGMYDYTPGIIGANGALGRAKNISVGGNASGDDDNDGYGGWPYGVASSVTALNQAGAVTTAAPSQGVYGAGSPPTSYPFPWVGWPSAQSYAQSGRRLAKHWMVNTSTALKVNALNWVCLVRGRRARVQIILPVGDPINTQGPGSGGGPWIEEPSQVGKGYFSPKYDSTVQNNIHILEIPQAQLKTAYTNPHTNTPLGIPFAKDCVRWWRPPLTGIHSSSTSNAFTMRGRLIPGLIPNPFNSTFQRGEGDISEIELNSMYLADLPLNEELLATL